MSKIKIKTFIPFLATLSVVIIDYITKMFIISNIMYKDIVNVVGDFLRVTFCYQTHFLLGSTFGSESSILKNVIFLVIYIAIILVIVYFYRSIKKERLFPRICFGLILGGIAGNFIDVVFGDIVFFGNIRLFFGNTVVWIDLAGIQTFNFADICTTIGIIMLVIYLISHKQSRIFKRKTMLLC